MDLHEGRGGKSFTTNNKPKTSQFHAKEGSLPMLAYYRFTTGILAAYLHSKGEVAG
jgi:hypothetical protein